MTEHEKILASGLLLFLLVAWFAFLFHSDPRFAGSVLGGVFGVLGAALMLVPYLYMAAKRVPPLRRAVSKAMTFRTFLELHIYAGIVGPSFGLLHSGHKFESITGITLTTLMLIVVFSGFVGRYLLATLSTDIRDKKAMLAALEQEYHHLSLEVAESAASGGLRSVLAGGGVRRLLRGTFPAASLPDGRLGAITRVVAVAESMADVEYALATDETVRAIFSGWLKLHIVLSLALLAVLALHIVSSFYFGVRWLT